MIQYSTGQSLEQSITKRPRFLDVGVLDKSNTKQPKTAEKQVNDITFIWSIMKIKCDQITLICNKKNT